MSFTISNGNLIGSGGGGGGSGDASSANQTTQIGLETDIKTAVESIDTKVSTSTKQDDQTALLTSIDLKNRIGVVWMLSQHIDITSIPSGGIDLRSLVPGKVPIFISSTLTSGSGQIHFSCYYDDDSSKVIRNFGPNYSYQAVFGKLFDTTNPAILPLQVFYA